MLKKRLIVYLLVWFVLSTITAGFAAVTLNWMQYYKFAKRGVVTQGWVVNKEPGNHRRIVYSYAVGQQNFSGSGSAGRGNPQFDALQVGNKVLVVYDPMAPEVSFLGDPNEQLWSITRGVVFLTILFPALLMIAYRLKSRRAAALR